MSQNRYFGTDGIRGSANSPLLNPAMVVKIAQAAGQVIKQQSSHVRPTVVIGKDTRLSGYMLEAALMSGFTSVGFYVMLVGPLPTPAIARLTRSMRADVGVMLTASHNPFGDNGMKFFTPNSRKFSQDIVAQIENLIDEPDGITLATGEHIGRAKRLDDAEGRYTEFLKGTLPKDFGLHGLKLVVDGANGAAYKLAPKLFWELGAEVIALGDDPNGLNINKRCGATAPEALAEAVKTHKADMGIALDGDADRLILVDNTGEVLDGDQILAALATYMHGQGTLRGNGVVATSMSNMGLEAYLQNLGLHLVRTDVGDHHVENYLFDHGYNLGGEVSGHIILRDHATTGDGILAALHVLLALHHMQKPASSIRQLYAPWPQKTANIPFPEGTEPTALLEKLAPHVTKAKETLGTQGRVIIRKSGTEPLVRIMVEAKEASLMEQTLQTLVDVANSA